MVEGPGCKLKGERMKGRLIGQTVEKVGGNAVERERKNQKKNLQGGAAETSFHRLVGKRLDDVCTLGKELFMIFGDTCLRVHFLMSGSFQVRGQQLERDHGGTADSASLEVTFDPDTMALYKCAVDVRSSESCLQRYRELHSLDICSPVFNHKRAVALVMEQRGRQVCDVLLDQAVLPGVGNIIKNEALFDSGIQPDTKIEDLKQEHISHLIKMTRDFSLIFYKCRRMGTSLERHMKVYKREQCRECGGRITICRQGQDNDRMTYFCPKCQTNKLQNAGRRLPTKTSLLGWLQTGGEGRKEEGEEGGKEKCCEAWTCKKCTLVNHSSRHSCSVCLASRYSDLALKKRAFSATSLHLPNPEVDVTVDLTGPEVAGISDPPSKKLCLEDCGNGESNVCNTAQVSLSNSVSALPLDGSRSLSNLRNSAASHQPQCKLASRPLVHSSPSVPSRSTSLSVSPVPAAPRLQPKKLASQRSSVAGASSHRSQPSDTLDPCRRIPHCHGHNQCCALRQTHKEGPNKRRWFFACAERVSTKRCNFFEWADSRFPICPGHGKPAALCTVLKPGANNGRRFFACPKPKKQQCSFFQWAEGFG